MRHVKEQTFVCCCVKSDLLKKKKEKIPPIHIHTHFYGFSMLSPLYIYMYDDHRRAELLKISSLQVYIHYLKCKWFISNGDDDDDDGKKSSLKWDVSIVPYNGNPGRSLYSNVRVMDQRSMFFAVGSKRAEWMSGKTEKTTRFRFWLHHHII